MKSGIKKEKCNLNQIADSYDHTDFIVQEIVNDLHSSIQLVDDLLVGDLLKKNETEIMEIINRNVEWCDSKRKIVSITNRDEHRDEFKDSSLGKDRTIPASIRQDIDKLIIELLADNKSKKEFEEALEVLIHVSGHGLLSPSQYLNITFKNSFYLQSKNL